MSIQNTALTATSASLLPATNARAFTVIYFCNTHSGAVTVTVYAVPGGSVAGTSTKIYDAVSIAAGDTLIIDTEKVLLDDGDLIQADASVDNVVIATCSYTEI